MDERIKSLETPEHHNGEESVPTGNRRGPTWRAWVVTILVAVVLSVTATLLLGGASSFRPESPAAASAGGCGGGCCGDQGK